VEHKYSLSINKIEELRWVHRGMGQVAQHDRVKTTVTSTDRISTANIVPRNGCCHPTPMWNTNIAYLDL
jgi:hypothetical protein